MGRSNGREFVEGWAIIDAVVVAVVALVGRVGYWLFAGTRTGADSDEFIATCSAWSTDPVDALTGQLVGVEYAGFTFPLCLVTDFLGASLDVWVAIQIALSTLSCLVVYATARRGLDRVAGLAAGLSMAVLWESFQWTVYVLSDAMFVVVVAVALWAVTRYDDLGTRRSWAITWLVLGLAAVTRPFGLPLVLGWFAYDLLPRGHRYRSNLLPHRAYLLVLAGVASLYYAVASRGTWVDSTMYKVWSDGVLVMNDPSFAYAYIAVERPEFLTFVVFNLHHLIAMGVLKVGLLFLPVVPRWSVFHNALNLITLVPVTLASAWAIFDLLRGNRRLIRLWVTPLLVLCFIVAVTFVDWDWRYRAPLAPVLSLLTGYAANRLWHGSSAERLAAPNR